MLSFGLRAIFMRFFFFLEENNFQELRVRAKSVQVYSLFIRQGGAGVGCRFLFADACKQEGTALTSALWCMRVHHWHAGSQQHCSPSSKPLAAVSSDMRSQKKLRAQQFKISSVPTAGEQTGSVTSRVCKY